MKTVKINSLGADCMKIGFWEIHLHNGNGGAAVRVRIKISEKDQWIQWGKGNIVEGRPDRSGIVYSLLLAWAHFDAARGDFAHYTPDPESVGVDGTGPDTVRVELDL